MPMEDIAEHNCLFDGPDWCNLADNGLHTINLSLELLTEFLLVCSHIQIMQRSRYQVLYCNI